MISFCYWRLFKGTETVSCGLSLQMAWMEMDCSLKKFFEFWCYVFQKSLRNWLWLALSDKIHLHIFVVALQWYCSFNSDFVLSTPPHPTPPHPTSLPKKSKILLFSKLWREMYRKSKENFKNIFRVWDRVQCSFTENWNEWESDRHETEQQGITGK